MSKLSTAVIEFATTETAFAAILIARSKQGVCTLLLGDTATELYADLQQRQPKAQIASKYDQALAPYLKKVTDF